jgi:hypothetical protein
MDMMLNLAIADEDGELVAHQADCPYVRKLADEGKPVATLLDVERPDQLGNLKRHSCLDGIDETIKQKDSA